MEKLRIALDLDDVILDLSEAWIKKYKEETKDDSNIIIKGWDVESYMPKVSREEVFGYLHKEYMYYNCNPVEGAVEGVRSLLEDDRFDILIISNCSFKYAYYEKLKWLELHISTEASEKLIGIYDGVLKNKMKSLYDIIVDDYALGMYTSGKIRILFDRPHNKHIPSTMYDYRVDTWKSLLERINLLWVTTQPQKKI